MCIRHSTFIPRFGRRKENQPDLSEFHSHALQHHLFQQLCEEMRSEHTYLLYHTDVRWLSRGKIFTRAIDLLDEI